LAWTNDWVKANLKNGKLAAIYKQYHGVDIPTQELLSKAGS
jgi:polar amino acid transport system substrate-binding protein